MFVQPQLQLNDVLQRQQAAIGYNYAGMNSLGREMTMTQEHLGVRPTGSASVFMYYSHYYPMAGAAGQRRARHTAAGACPRKRCQISQTRHTSQTISRTKKPSSQKKPSSWRTRAASSQSAPATYASCDCQRLTASPPAATGKLRPSGRIRPKPAGSTARATAHRNIRYNNL